MASILLIDALNLFTRQYVKNPSMTTNGSHSGGIVGFLGAVKFLLNKIQPSQTIIVWEGGGSIRKRGIYPDYKQNRKPVRMNRYYEDDIPDSKENRNEQIALLVKLLNYVPVKQIYAEDCEADDVIGFLCRNTFKDEKKIIASSDRDFYQLIDENTLLYSWTKRELVDSADIFKETGIYPRNYLTARIFSGDPSDNIGGVRGAGFKTLIKRFPFITEDRDVSYHEIIEAASKMLPSKLKIINSIAESKELADRNWRLMHLDTKHLAPLQVRSVEAMIEAQPPLPNKIMFMKESKKYGIMNVDIHDLFSSFLYNAVRS